MNPAWALLRLASPQLPIGGYSYSQGLEMAVEQATVNDPHSARRWISDQLLLNLARFEAPLLLAHCQAATDEDWAQLLQLCQEHRASRETRELHQESRQMGYSLQQLLNGLPELDAPARAFLEQITEPHLALGWALAARAWRISPQDALAAWLWSWLENQLAVLMKTLPLGQQAAQRLTSELLPLLQQAQRNASNLDPEHYGSAAFGLALACMAHERQYSRLFRS
ncbi:Urease accessory protein UreF [Pseudomonas chlororaphis subsp. aureofaciens]|uniref:Urease accessory protein UreF n=1 Tax=Pseudomonas chlororaphis subsp. aureofaciens TaxID=587851 RepID=A0AAD1E406_9PSED|nr:urease accessory protein UreF [Pseudomonas chlororaphis]AZE21068.1 Urease accessory protein UreF [Pseudomonas chlororaphis subsp. aureofaciens]AZE27423.1 Urease accessory protein UreF [Pseudomonas chlororaphis subsp. aureofaciens]AZE33670.1 Urease accessory protein UreF [Pseudomonas chlororaphis subsp. aureofaciens]AZE40005.1 Urease accessory protein UreF [Pseudomonas chlororaphis subsp. aureofaciens]QHC87335.1 urease accessory protein UreF [Pseudomonas chlororaphis]